MQMENRMEPDKTDCLGHSFVHGERHQHFGPCLHPGQGIYMFQGWLRQWEMRESHVSEVRGSGGIRSLFWGQFASRTQEALVQAGLGRGCVGRGWPKGFSTIRGFVGPLHPAL